MPENKACRLRLSHYILLPFAGLPACHNIHTTVKKEHNHNSPAARIRPHAPFSADLAPFHTSKQHLAVFHVPENTFRSHSTIQLSADQNSDCAKERSVPLPPAPSAHNIWRTQNMPLFYFRSSRPLPAETVPARGQPLYTVYDNTAPSRNNIAAAAQAPFPPPASSCIFSNSGQDRPHTFFCDRFRYRNIISCLPAQ